MIFTTTAEIKKHHPCLITFKFEEIEHLVRQVGEDEIVPLIGDALYEELTGESSSSVDDALLEKVRDVLAPLIFYYYIPFAQGKVGTAGILIVQNEGETQAPGWMIREMRSEAYEKAMKAAERLLKWLEKNKADYDSWVDSDAYTVFKELFINTVDEFHDEVNIDKSRRTFLALKQKIKLCEKEYIKPILGTTLFDAIKEDINSGEISAEFEPLLDLIRTALANLSIASAINSLNLKIDKNGITLYEALGNDDPKRKQPLAEQLREFKQEHQQIGENFLKKLSDYLRDNKDDYSDYVDSDEAEENDGEHFTNDSNQSVGGFF